MDEEDGLPTFGNLTVTILTFFNLMQYITLIVTPRHQASQIMHALVMKCFNFYSFIIYVTGMLKVLFNSKITLKVSFSIGIHKKLISFCGGTC